MELGRRHFLAAFATPMIIGTAATASLARQASLARTRHGPVAGRFTGGAHEFLGVRYGASTSGSARFMPPRPPQSWSRPLEALAYGPASPQSDPDSTATGPREAESEDCLTLNVWTPGIRDGGKRPVMVWLHGGGLWRLSAAGRSQAGGRLAANGDVVMVSPNHRLGVLGYAYLQDFDPMFTGSASAGMLDIVQALQWVRDNIEEFGGDPGNVTIFGQSGGGQKVSLLMAMPAAQGLFHKAIIQSGPAPLALEKHYGRDLAERLLHLLGISETRARDIQAVPLSAIMKAYYQIFRDIGGFGVMGVIQDFAPVIDGDTLPQHPFWNGASPLSRNIPLMIGSTRTEMTEYTLAGDPEAWKRDFAGITEHLRCIFGADTQGIVDQYRAAHPDAGAWEVDQLIRSDWPTRLFSQRIADEQARLGGAPVWMYRMDWKTKASNGLLMSPHAIDIPFVLDTVGTEPIHPGQEGEQRQMLRQMNAAWLSFARDGHPHSDAFPKWTSYDADRRPTMIFDLRSRMVDDPDGGDLDRLKTGLQRYRVVAGGLTSATAQGDMP